MIYPNVLRNKERVERDKIYLLWRVLLELFFLLEERIESFEGFEEGFEDKQLKDKTNLESDLY